MVDVRVMGAGIFGLATAYVCARRGAVVQVVDPRGPGGGASGGLVGALAPHVPENWNDKKAFQLESLLMAEAFWAEVAARAGISPGYARTGRIQPLMDTRAVALAEARIATAATLWQGRAVWRVCPVTEIPGWPLQSPTGLVIHDTLSARLHPRLACAALAGALISLGGAIVTEESGPAGATVWATGYEGLESLSKALGASIGGGVKGQALLLNLPGQAPARWPQLFADGLHLVPHEDGTVALGSTTERDFESPDATDAQVDALLVRACAALPFLKGAEVLARHAGVRPRARSLAPMLGAWPGRSGHYIANGGFKIGFGMAPKVAEVMADLVLDGEADIPAGFTVAANL